MWKIINTDLLRGLRPVSGPKSNYMRQHKAVYSQSHKLYGIKHLTFVLQEGGYKLIKPPPSMDGIQGI